MGLLLAKQQHSNLICFNVVFVETTVMVHLAQLFCVFLLSSTYLQTKLCVNSNSNL